MHIGIFFMGPDMMLLQTLGVITVLFSLQSSGRFMDQVHETLDITCWENVNNRSWKLKLHIAIQNYLALFGK